MSVPLWTLLAGIAGGWGLGAYSLYRFQRAMARRDARQDLRRYR